MLEKANRNKQNSGAENVVFTESPITNISLKDEIAHCIISNCVINLVPTQEKQLVFNEMYRLLQPGGRVALSDILAKRELSDEIKNDMTLYVGCIAGASLVQDYERYLQNAGFSGKSSPVIVYPMHWQPVVYNGLAFCADHNYVML